MPNTHTRVHSLSLENYTFRWHGGAERRRNNFFPLFSSEHWNAAKNPFPSLKWKLKEFISTSRKLSSSLVVGGFGNKITCFSQAFPFFCYCSSSLQALSEVGVRGKSFEQTKWMISVQICSRWRVRFCRRKLKNYVRNYSILFFQLVFECFWSVLF